MQIWSKPYVNLLCKVEQKVNMGTQEGRVDVRENCSPTFIRSFLSIFSRKKQQANFSYCGLISWGKSQLSPLRTRRLVWSTTEWQWAEMCRFKKKKKKLRPERIFSHSDVWVDTFVGRLCLCAGAARFHSGWKISVASEKLLRKCTFVRRISLMADSNSRELL